jgi:predicted phage terminase large subunit-like protein
MEPSPPASNDGRGRARVRGSGSDEVGLLRTALARSGDVERWLRVVFPGHFEFPFASFHRVALAWLRELRSGVRPEPLIAVLARGAGKSKLSEAAVVWAGFTRRRWYVWYCSATQRQANDHVRNIAELLSSPRLAALDPELCARDLTKYGTSVGWRGNRLSTRSGLTIDAVALDADVRGGRVDTHRPDFIIFDDLDSALDTPALTEKKIITLTRTILPAGSTHCAVLGIQNVILPNGVFAQLAGVAAMPVPFLITRKLIGPIPAIDGLIVDRDDTGRLRIAAGEPTWVGQDLDYCQALLNEIGETAFRIELQHQVELRESGMFDRSWWRPIERDDVPRTGIRWVRYWDLAATEPTGSNRDPDWTAGALLGFNEDDGLFYLRDIRRFRDTPRGVEMEIARVAELDATRYTRTIWIEQEPGASGASTIDHYRRRVLPGYDVRGDRPSGPKHERARPLSAAAEHGNVFVVNGEWNAAFFDEAALFPLPPGQGHDDQIDAVTGAMYALTRPRARLVV